MAPAAMATAVAPLAPLGKHQQLALARSKLDENRKSRLQAKAMQLPTQCSSPVLESLAKLHGCHTPLPIGLQSELLLAAMQEPRAHTGRMQNVCSDLAAVQKSLLHPHGRLLGSMSKEAREAGVPQQRWPEYLCAVGGGFYHASAAFATAFLSWVHQEIKTLRLVGVALIVATWSDATCMELSLAGGSESGPQGVTAAVVAAWQLAIGSRFASSQPLNVQRWQICNTLHAEAPAPKDIFCCCVGRTVSGPLMVAARLSQWRASAAVARLARRKASAAHCKLAKQSCRRRRCRCYCCRCFPLPQSHRRCRCRRCCCCCRCCSWHTA